MKNFNRLVHGLREESLELRELAGKMPDPCQTREDLRVLANIMMTYANEIQRSLDHNDASGDQMRVIRNHFNEPDWDNGAPTCAVLEDRDGNPVEDHPDTVLEDDIRIGVVVKDIYGNPMGGG